LGVRHLETYDDHLPFASSPEHLEKTRALLQTRGIELVTFGVIGFIQDSKRSRRIFEFAKAMGLYSLTADPELETLDEVEALAQEFEINVGIHPHGPDHPRYHGWQDVEKLVAKRHQRMGLCADVGHISRVNEDPIEGILAFRDRVYGVHLKDIDTQNQDVALGLGRVDIIGILRALEFVGYRGVVSIECEMNPHNPVPDIRHAINYLKSLDMF
jgi:sugar phosphate isomerase/epimerase